MIFIIFILFINHTTAYIQKKFFWKYFFNIIRLYNKTIKNQLKANKS